MIPAYNVHMIDNKDSFAQLIMGELEKRKIHVRHQYSEDKLSLLPYTDAILLGPGPNGPEQSGNYMEAIETYKEKYPIRGICLGFQSIVSYFGGEIEPIEVCHGKIAEVEHIEEGIFKGINSPANLARYNSLGLTVENTPDCFDIVATQKTKKGEYVMAVRHKDYDIAGIQFHPESILSGRAGEKVLDNLFR